MKYKVQHMNTCTGYANPNTPKLDYEYKIPILNNGMDIIDKIREEKGLTQDALANKAGFSPQIYSDSKNQKIPLTKYRVIALATAFDFSLEDTIKLLDKTGFRFNPADQRDCVIMHCIEVGVHDVEAIRDQLTRNGYTSPFDKRKK